MTPLRLFTAATCHVNNPLLVLRGQGIVSNIFADIGYSFTPMALTSGMVVQLHDRCAGALDFPDEILRLIEVRTDRPVAGAAARIAASEACLIELTSLFEMTLGGAALNVNRVAEHVHRPLAAAGGIDAKALSQWWQAVGAGREDDRAEHAATLLASIPDDRAYAFAASCVAEIRTRRLDEEAIAADLRALRERLPVPLALAHTPFRWTPDGRPLDWPAGFRELKEGLCRDLGIAFLDFIPHVERLGFARAINEDLVHWRSEAYPVQGEIIFDFMAGLLGAPTLAERRGRPVG